MKPLGKLPARVDMQERKGQISLLVAIASAAAAIGFSGCSGETCPGAGLVPGYVALFGAATDEQGCTIRVTESQAEQTRQLPCEPRLTNEGQEVCACFGSNRPGDYVVHVYDAESDRLLDEAVISVVAAANGCPSAAFVDPFNGFGGMGGMGGMGGAFTSGQSGGHGGAF